MKSCVRALDSGELVLKEVDDAEIAKLKEALLRKLERLEWLMIQPHQRADYSPVHVGFVRSAIFLLNAIWK